MTSFDAGLSNFNEVFLQLVRQKQGRNPLLWIIHWAYTLIIYFYRKCKKPLPYMLEINFSHFPVILTSRLILRRIAKADAGDFFRLRSDKNIMQHIGRPIALNIDDAVQLIEVIEDQFQNNSGITWGITMKEEKKIIGTVGLWRIIKEHHRAEIGYLLGTSFQGRGLMQEAIEPVIEYGFKKIKLHTIEANVSPLNTASIKLLEKNNFIREAHFKENYFFDGKFLDSFVYSLITPYKN